MTAKLDLAKLPPFELQVIIQSVLDSDNLSKDLRTPPRIVCCAEGAKNEVFIGCHDGSLLRYVLPELEGVLAESYILLARTTVPNGKSVDEIHLLPQCGRVLALSDHRLHFYSYPNLDSMHADLPLKNVIAVCLDERPSMQGRQTQPPSAEICVLKGASMAIYSIKEKVTYRRDLPFSDDIKLPKILKRAGRYLCLADSQNYSMIDLEEGTLLPCIPLCPTNDDSGGHWSPSITVVDEEFLVLQWNGVSTLGVFIKGTGDYSRLLEYKEDRVNSVAVGASSLVALLDNGTLQMHNISNLEKIQELTPSPRLPAPVSLSCNKLGTLSASTQRQDRLRLLKHSFMHRKALESDKIADVPPQTRSKLFVYSRSRVLVHGNNSISSLVPRSRITQAEELIDAHRIQDCVTFLDKRPTSSGGPPDPDEVEETCYLQQRLGYRCFNTTLFEDAGMWLFRGKLDPRLLIDCFPDLVGSLLDDSPGINIYAGLHDYMPTNSADEISKFPLLSPVSCHLPPSNPSNHLVHCGLTVVDNLVRNYSPHLHPNTRSAPSTAELRKLLNQEARNMLHEYLRKWHNMRKYQDSSETSPAVDRAVDTVLLRLLAEREQTEDVMTLILESDAVSLKDVEEPLIRCGQYHALCILLEKRKEVGKLLDAIARIYEKEWTEPQIQDPLDRMFEILSTCQDSAIVERWQFWLIERDSARGIKLLISQQKSKTTDHLALLHRLQSLNTAAGERYLEFLVLEKKLRDPSLHTKLAQISMQRLFDMLTQEPSLRDAVASSLSSYSAVHTSQTFLLTISPAQSSYKVARLKLLLFLQASSSYDAGILSQNLEAFQWSSLLLYECAILKGKLDDHDAALSTLIRDLRDFTSAELYCTRGGNIIPPQVLNLITLRDQEKAELGLWTNFFTSSGRRKENKSPQPESNKLVFKLLRVYLENEEHSAYHAERLLASQATSLNAEEVLPIIPSHWSARSIRPFVESALRNEVHCRHELQIVNALYSARSLEVSEKAWLRLREEGYVVEEAGSDDEETVNEKGLGTSSFSEKQGLPPLPKVVDVHVTPDD